MATIRGTTPTVTFNLPFDVSEIANCEVYFAQEDELLVTKGYDDCVIDTDYNTLAVTLTQSDTLQFDADKKLQMQLRFVYTDGRVDATEELRGKVGKILKDGEIDVD